jgi:NAD(P)H-hydrate repair Nnr-like enzyme with NAD(P)H-hydrate dehydratase domain
VSRQNGAVSGTAAEPQEITEAWARSVLPRRGPQAHKWEVGGLVVVAGSPPYAGAAALCCASAGRSGAGIISAALPRSIAPIVVGLVPEVTVVLLPEGENTSTAKRASDAIGERLTRSKALVIGPGLGSDEATNALLAALFGSRKANEGIGFGTRGAGAETPAESVVLQSGKPAVLDADALNWLARQGNWWEAMSAGRFVLTPHAGEMARLIDGEVETVLADPVAVAQEAAARWAQVVVLKGARTIVVDPSGSTMFAESTPALATAGSGDVLSGSIGAFLAQGLSSFDAAALAVYVGDRAAGQLAKRLGTLGVVAGDLPFAIAEVLGALEGEGS